MNFYAKKLKYFRRRATQADIHKSAKKANGWIFLSSLSAPFSVVLWQFSLGRVCLWEIGSRD